MRGRAIIAILVAIVLLSGCGAKSTAPSVFATPSASRTTYASPSFGYLLTYPTQWLRDVVGDGYLVRFIPKTVGFIPDALALDVECASNPKELSAHDWWTQSQSSGQTQSAVGTVKLKTGVVAFESHGYGQTDFTVYTVANASRVCQLRAYDIDTLNNPYTMQAVNTFAWR